MNNDATIAPAPAQPTDSHNYTDPSGSINNAQGDKAPVDVTTTSPGAPSGKIPTPTAMIPAPPTITTIGSMNTQPTTPVVVPPATISTSSNAGAAINGSASAMNPAPITPVNNSGGTATPNGDTSLNPLINAQNTKISTDTSTVTTAKSDLDTLIAKLAGEGQDQINQEAKAGIPALTKQNQDLISLYNTTKAGYDAQYQNILNTPGMTREQANQQVTELQRVNNANLANIAIQQSVVQGNLKVATDLIDHKIALEYGNLKDLITYQTNYLKSNQDTLSNDQKEALQLQITQNTRTYDKATADAKTLETQKLDTLKAMAQNGASVDAMSEVQSQTTPEAVIATAGKYGVSLADQLTKANIAKAYADAQKAQTVVPDMKGETLVLGKDTGTAATFEKAGITTADIVGIQNYLQKGYSLNQIAKMTNMPATVYATLIPYISVPKEGSAL